MNFDWIDFILILFPTIINVIAISGMWIHRKVVAEFNSSKKWISLEAIISKIGLENGTSTHSFTSQVDVKYEFTVQGTSYIGNRICFGYSGTNIQTSHRELYDVLQKAETVEIWYNPRNPSKSVMVKDIYGSTLFLYKLSKLSFIIINSMVVFALGAIYWPTNLEIVNNLKIIK